MYYTKKQLYAKTRELGIKNTSMMNKRQLEDALLLYYEITWFHDIAGNKIVVSDDEVEIEPVEVIDLTPDS